MLSVEETQFLKCPTIFVCGKNQPNRNGASPAVEDYIL